ncbi:MAG: hypothetical protein WDM79_15385 [Terricaulis sp.]
MRIGVWILRGLERLLIGAGLLLWVFIGLLAVLAAWAMNWDAPPSMSDAPWWMRSAAALGVFMTSIGSVVVLRITKQWRAFALTVAFGALLWGYAFYVFDAIHHTLADAPFLYVAVGLAVWLIFIFGAGAFPSRAWGVVIATVFGAAPLIAVAVFSYANINMRSETVSGVLEVAPQTLDVAPEEQSALSDQFQIEELRFNKPERMRINHAYVVEAQIGADAAPILGDVGDTVTRDITIPESRHVRVELIANDFEIEQLHQVEDVLIAPGTTGTWTWRVTPRVSGAERRMLLQVYGLVQQNGRDGQVLIKTYEETIPVDVTPLDQAQIYAEAFLSRWDVIAGIAGAIGGLWMFFSAIVKWFRRPRGRAQPA